MKLSILVPAYMEQGNIGPILERIDRLDLSSLGLQKEVVVCDDGSTDGTSAAVETFQPRNCTVALLRHSANRGKGAAIRTALARASGEYAIVQDADLEYDVEDYPVLLEPLVNGEADVVFGSRFLRRFYPTGMNVANFVANKILTLTANLLFDHGITDEATCFKAFRTSLLRDLDLNCSGFEFCPEVVAKLGVRGVRIREVPIEYRARNVAEGKKVRWTDGFEALWVMSTIKAASTFSRFLKTLHPKR